MMKLSVVIICWNSLSNLKELFASLPDALEGLDSEVIVVDNGSTDGTEAWLKQCGISHSYMKLDRNYGVAAARNKGIEEASGRYVWLLDDDTIINLEAARGLVEYMDSHPDCGIAACTLRAPDGALQRSYKPFPGIGMKVRNMLGMDSSDPYSAELAAGLPFEPTYVIGACQMIRRELFLKVGMLDSRIFYGPEDADFCLRVRKAGMHIAYLPNIEIIHKWKRITTRRPFSPIGRAHIRGLLHLYFKHRKLF